MKRILEAPPWDLIVFDEAHHLTATQSGNKVSQTQNFKLGEKLRDHSRDILLLSATPHQGDHFRFWMLIRLLHPTLFLDVQDMITSRHRLNAVVFRRTQADACNANGEPLFSRRQVHTQAFHLSEAERRFYDAMMDYLRDGYDMAAQAGKQGRALGFVMTIFQKIAASSFAAVEATLRRRLLSLTIHEAIACDENLDPDGRDRAMNEARGQIREMFDLANDALGRAEADRILADARVKLLRKLGEKTPADETGTELDAVGDEESAATLVSLALPAERRRIFELLELIPRYTESKTQELLRALGALWAVHPGEKIVVFTTYLGSVDALRSAIDQEFPQSGVEVLKGGDHGAKLAAERRFKRRDGPRVLVCTAAGREGINLQFARVLFNHDLPWNPMDVEQRIGRIHRYGQEHTAQVYNLVSADTIEGKIYLLLEEKLLAIANAVGKVDEYGQVAEDLREKILAAFPAAYRGEETGTASGSDTEHVWLVDPNDGTSAYLKGWGGSAVSIALVRQGTLVLGVVYAPTYPDDNGDLFAWAEGCGPVTRNGKPVTADLAGKDLNGGTDIPAIVFVSQDGDRNRAANAACVAPTRFIAMPSIAYRLALVAAGEGVAAASLNGPGAWGYAGGHALLVGSGGTLIDQDGRPIGYGPHGESHCQWCFGGAPAAIEALCRRDWGSVFSSPAKSASPYALVRPERGVSVPDPGQLSRAQGCVLGQLVGDSLGGLVEFSSAARIKSKYPSGLRQLMDGGHWGILAGQPTDDSEMALMLARSIVPNKGYEPAAALDAYLHWYSSPPFDIGGTTSAALSGARNGRTPQERLAGAKQHANTSSQANGSLMRISPLGIFGAGNPAVAADWARADSSLTHPHQVCQDSCAVFVAAIATAIASGCSAQDCYQVALDEAKRSSAVPSVVEALREAAERPPNDYQTQQGWVLIALQNAFYQLLHAPSLEEGVVRTVMAGGDTDTNAAIAGALLGAIHGREGMPPQWLLSVLSCRLLPKSGTSHPRPIEFWPVDALSLAERLLVLGSRVHDAEGTRPVRGPERNLEERNGSLHRLHPRIDS